MMFSKHYGGDPAAAAMPCQNPVFMATTLRYSGVNDILVRGPATGRRYRFSPREPLQPVALRDVEELLRHRLFRRA